MKICVYASGSSGNCLLVSENGTNILIDAGISLRRIEQSLARSELSMNDIGGVLITHEHSDHISALKQMAKKHRTKLFAPHTVANRIIGMLPETEELFSIIPVGESFTLGNLCVRAFHTSHDTDESVGYRIGGAFALATDTGCVTDEIREGLCGAEAVLIESNHDEELLRYGPYPFYLKKRILSDRGHLSNENCAALARELQRRGTSKIILGHLSHENNTPDTAMSCAKAALCGTGAELFCAPVSGCLSVEVCEVCSE